MELREHELLTLISDGCSVIAADTKPWSINPLKRDILASIKRVAELVEALPDAPGL